MLHLLNRLYPVRYTAFSASLLVLLWSVATLVSAGPAPVWAWMGTVVASALVVVGLRDITQTFSAVRRNYPIIGHIRFMLEKI
ncbi:MAG: FMN-binding glutamate synthase family protein, partial [Burkholderiales bacterium]|nr:FMN-binding glutamate synthase family protein [Burkholderiales bacterium]